jgi:hypothetical protein
MSEGQITDIAARSELGPKAGLLMHELVHLIVVRDPRYAEGLYRQVQGHRARPRSHLVAR